MKVTPGGGGGGWSVAHTCTSAKTPSSGEGPLISEPAIPRIAYVPGCHAPWLSEWHGAVHRMGLNHEPFGGGFLSVRLLHDFILGSLVF